MNLQNVAKIVMPDGEVKAIHNSNGDLLWGKVNYSVKYSGGSSQDGTPTPSSPVPIKVVTGENTLTISDGTNTQSYEVNLGKNLLDEASVMRGYELVGATGAIVENVNWWVSDIIPVMPNTPYTSSGWDNGNTNKYWYRSDNSYIERTTAKTVTSPSDAAYMRVNGRLTQLGKTIMVEQGSTATDYAPYFTPIELCKIGTYQDYIYKSGGKWYVHKEVGKAVLDGSESWYNAGGNAPYGLVIDDGLITTSNDNPPLVYCDKFYPVAQNGTWSAYDSLISTNKTSSSTKTIRIRYTSVSSLSAFQTWLGNNNATLYYALATPTDTEITNEALMAQLDAVNQWLTRYGYNATVSGNLPIIIDRTAL